MFSNYKTAKKLVFSLLFSVTGVVPAHAGLLSTLAKIGAKVDAPDAPVIKAGDINFRSLDLPEIQSATFVRAKLDANQNWVLSGKDNMIVRTIDEIENPVLYLDKANLPRDLSTLDRLPREHKLLLRDGNTVFELKRGSGLTIKLGAASIQTRTYNQLLDAVWQLKTPWKKGPIRVLGLSDVPQNSVAIAKGVAAKTLLQSPQKLRKQTIVLAGPIKNDSILVAGKSFQLNKLGELARKFDISFVILETHNNLSPKKISKQLEAAGAFDGNPTTGEFLTQVRGPVNAEHYSISPSGDNHVLISRLTTKESSLSAPETTLAGESAVHAVIIHSVLFYRPDSQHQQDLDMEIVPGLSLLNILSYIGLAIPGFWAWAECNWLMNKIWPRTTIATNSLRHRLLRVLRFFILIFLLIPLIGFAAALFKIARIVWMVLSSLASIVYSVISWPIKVISSFRMRWIKKDIDTI